MPKTYTEILKRILSWKYVCIASSTRITGLPSLFSKSKADIDIYLGLGSFFASIMNLCLRFLPSKFSLIYILVNTCVKSLPLGFPCGSAGKESACNAGDLCSIPGLGGYPHQYSDLENSMDCTIHRVAKSRTQLSDVHFKSLHWCLTLWDPVDCVVDQDPLSMDSPGKTTRVGFHAILQGIFPT